MKPFKYSFKSTTTDAVLTGCSESATRPSYVHCTGNTLPLSDDDLGPSCDTTDQQGRFYIWEHSREMIHSLVLSFSQTISPTHIRLHYFSDPVNGIGVPTLQLYANIEKPWDTPTGTDVRIANVRAMLKDESEPPRREIHDITLNPASLQLDTLLLRIRFFDGNAVSSFYLSEVEVFTCSPGIGNLYLTSSRLNPSISWIIFPQVTYCVVGNLETFSPILPVPIQLY